MSTLKTIYLQHLNGSGTNATLDANGNMTVAGTVAGASSNMFRNRIINGAAQIWQRGTSFTSITTNTYTTDRFYVNIGTPGTGVFRVDQVTDTPSGQGFPYSMKLYPTTAMSSVGGATYLSFVQLIEGFNVADLAYGTSAAKSITISFWVKSNITGITCGTLIQNGGYAGTDRSYPFNYTINAADTWQQVIVTIPGDTGGTISYNNAWGLQLNLGYMAVGTNYQNGSINTWNANPSGNSYLASGFSYINRASSTSNYMSFTGIQLEVGTVATPFEFRQYGTEMGLCMRYYINYSYPTYGSPIGFTFNAAGVSNWHISYPLPVFMRTAPTLTWSEWTTSNASSTKYFQAQGSGGFNVYCASSGAGYGYFFGGYTASAEL